MCVEGEGERETVTAGRGGGEREACTFFVFYAQTDVWIFKKQRGKAVL